MTAMESLTADQLRLLEDAQDKVTRELMDDLDYGEEVELNELYCLYHYTEDDIFVINLVDEWEEILQVQYNGDDIEFEAL
jgi:hypothetical protein